MTQDRRSSGDRAKPRWVRAGINSTRPLWGFEEGIQVGLWPTNVEGGGDEGGPRGLFRIAYPILEGGKRQGLVNFVAVEPVVRGERGYSELERGADGRNGLRFWSGDPGHPHEGLDRGITEAVRGVEHLRVMVYTERFRNGAQPAVQLRFRADRPGEVHFTVFRGGGADMELCILTATMGNYMRLRLLHLRGETRHARACWPDFEGREFTADALFGLERLPRARSGDVLVCATTDEADPGAVPVDPVAPWWRYRGSFPLTQYWRVPRGRWQPDLRLRVNGRRLYWANHTPIPGGISYENFELQQAFKDGQEYVFGLSRQAPAALLRAL